MTDTINFTRGVPANESFPADELLASARTAFETQGSGIFQYGPSPGYRPLREWLAAWRSVDADNVLVSNGSLQIIEFLCVALLEPGDVVFTETPTYDRTLTLLQRHGATVTGVPTEEDGPDIAALTRALERQVPKFLYLIPDFQNPTGATCSAAKRTAIVELARRHGFLIVEDGPYRQLRYRGTEAPTLYELAPERTVHLSSFTKLIAPGIRTGFIFGDAPLIARIAKVAEDTYICPSYMAQGIAFEWCRRGLLQPQIARLKALYEPRLDACLQGLDRYLPEAAHTRPDGGFFVSLTLPPGADVTAVRAEAARHKLMLTDGHAFFPSGGGDRFLRLPFCALTPAEIDEGLRRLAASVKVTS